MGKISRDGWAYIINLVVDNAMDAVKNHKENPKELYALGVVNGYYEAMDTIKNQLIARGEILSDFGLDFELEKTMF